MEQLKLTASTATNSIVMTNGDRSGAVWEVETGDGSYYRCTLRKGDTVVNSQVYTHWSAALTAVASFLGFGIVSVQ